MDRRRILLIAAAMIAALGTLLVFVYVRGADNRAREGLATTDVLVATAQIDQGESIEDAAANGKLALKPIVTDELLTGYQTSTDTLKGTTALTTIYPGEQVITDKFGAAAGATSDTTALTPSLQEGQVARTITLTDSDRVAGFVSPGSEVMVMYSGTNAQGQPFSRTLFPRLTVIAVGATTTTTTTTTDETGTQTTEALPATIITLAVDQTEAEKLTFAAGNGTLSFALLTDTSQVKDGPGITADNLFN